LSEGRRHTGAALHLARALLLLLSILSASCVTVAPWERGKLASPCMEQGSDRPGMSSAYRAKVLESKVGGGLPGTAPGGGCGCTQ